MKRTILAACVSLAVAGLTVAAQTPQTSPPQAQAPAATSPSGNAGTMTVTGCLKPWSGTSTTTPAEPTAKSAGDVMYQLTNIEDNTKKPGTAAGSASTAPHNTYLLKAKDQTVNLSQHLNHKVQVTGTVSSESTMSPGASATKPSTPPSTPPSEAPGRDIAASAANKPATLIVSSITMVSATCPTTF